MKLTFKHTLSIVFALMIGLPAMATTTLPNGTYTIQQRSNMRYLDAHESGNDNSAVTRTSQDDESQKWVITYAGRNTYTIQQSSSLRYLDAHESGSDYSAVTRPAQNNDSQKWIITKIGADTYTLQQKSTRRFLDAHG